MTRVEPQRLFLNLRRNLGLAPSQKSQVPSNGYKVPILDTVDNTGGHIQVTEWNEYLNTR